MAHNRICSLSQEPQSSACGGSSRSTVQPSYSVRAEKSLDQPSVELHELENAVSFCFSDLTRPSVVENGLRQVVNHLPEDFDKDIPLVVENLPPAVPHFVEGLHLEKPEYSPESGFLDSSLSGTAVGPISSTEESNVSVEFSQALLLQEKQCLPEENQIRKRSMVVTVSTNNKACEADIQRTDFLKPSATSHEHVNSASVGPVSSPIECTSIPNTDETSAVEKILHSVQGHDNVLGETSASLAEFTAGLSSETFNIVDSRREQDEADRTLTPSAPLIPLVLCDLENDSMSDLSTVNSPSIGSSSLVEVLSPTGDHDDPDRLGSPPTAPPQVNLDLEDLSTQQTLRVDIFQRRPDLLRSWNSERAATAQTAYNQSVKPAQTARSTEEPDERRVLQRKRNMLAARKSRDKKKQEHERLRKELNVELSEHTRLTYNVKRLQREKMYFSSLLNAHKCSNNQLLAPAITATADADATSPPPSYMEGLPALELFSFFEKDQE